MSCALIVRNVSTAAVLFGEDLLLPGQHVEVRSHDLLLDDALSDELRMLVDDKLLAVDPPEPLTCH